MSAYVDLLDAAWQDHLAILMSAIAEHIDTHMLQPSRIEAHAQAAD